MSIEEIARITVEFFNEVEIACFNTKNKIAELYMATDAKKAVSAPTPKPETAPLPGTDFSRLPWKSYKTKEAAEPNEAAWIFSNANGAEALLATLKSKDWKATIGTFEYQLQGKDRQFIARKPVK
jgi:cell division septation protein DedD